MALGLCSYYLYLLSCLAALFAAGASAAISIINPILLLPLAGFLFAYLLAMAADRRISNVFSQFWFEQQQNLREALKQARQKVQAERQQNPLLDGAADPYDGLVAPLPSALDGLASIHMSGTQL